MANINSLTSSNSYGNSYNLYGNRNVLTGLASGMDTEAMIQNSIAGYQMKITSLMQSQTKLQWKQDAFRDIIDQMNSIIQKYTSYTSKTNLSSNSFFTSARKTEAVGSHASAVSATGSTKSDIRLNAVTQLATSARYSVDAKSLDIKAASKAAGSAIKWSEERDIGQVNGTMTLKYGNQTIELNFDESDTDLNTADGLKAAIEKKLSNINIKAKDGSSVKASSLISVESDGNTFKFVANKSSADYDGSAVYINSISGNVSTTLGASRPASTLIEEKVKNNSFTVSDMDALVKKQNTGQYLTGKTVEVTVDGVTKTIKIGDLSNVKLTEETQRKIAAYEEDIKRQQAALDGKKEILATKNEKVAEYETKIAGFNGEIEDYNAKIADLQQQIADAKAENEDADVSALEAEIEGYENDIADLESKINDIKEDAEYKAAVEDRDNYAKEIEADEAELGRTKQLRADAINDDMNEALQKDLQASINKAFGKDRVTVEIENGGLYFKVTEGSGSTIKVTSAAGESLGIGKSGVSNYFNTANTIKDLIDDKDWLNSNARIDAVGDVHSTGTGDDAKWYDAEGNRVVKGANGNWYRADENGKYLYSLDINGVRVGAFNEDTSLESIITAINSNSEAGVKVSYSNLTGQFVFTANETGEGGEISFDSALAKRLFTNVDEDGKQVGKFEEGKDAIIHATVNGTDLVLKRSSNVVNMDGLTVTLKDTFNVQTDEDGNVKMEDGVPLAAKGEAVTFKNSSDSDPVVDTIKSFVEDINKLMQSVHDAYATKPLTKSTSSSSGYDPLTEEDKASMSESAIAAYEEKAKTGLLFGDTDLSQLYSRLLSTIQATGADRMDMEAIGLTTTYSNGVTQLVLDEDKLRAALDSDPDKVRNVFTKTVDSGSKTNGLMGALKTTLNNYGSISLGSPGILVSKAGTKLSSISLINNNLQKQIDNLDRQIEQWQSRMSDKVDYYTRQFTQLEKLMSTMNNQSSMLASLMGGY